MCGIPSIFVTLNISTFCSKALVATFPTELDSPVLEFERESYCISGFAVSVCFTQTGESDYPINLDSDYPILKIARIRLRTLIAMHTGAFRIIRSTLIRIIRFSSIARYWLRTSCSQFCCIGTGDVRNIRYMLNRIIRLSRIIRS